MIIPYNCKFCKTQRVATFNGENPDVVYKMEVWKSMLACNPCADYRMGRRKYIDAIRSACLSVVRAKEVSQGEKLTQVRNQVREVLVHVTKKLSGIVCNHHGVTNVWEMEFVNTLLDSPDKWLQIVNQYIKGVAAIKRDAERLAA